MTKIIHILAHNIEDFISGNYDDFDHHSIRFVEKIRHFATIKDFQIEQELWTLSKKNKKILEIEHQKGFKIKIFPISIKLPLPLEISFSLLKEAIQFKSPEKTIWHLHGYYFFMYDIIAPILFLKKQKFLMHYRGGGPSFTPKAILYTLYHYLIGLRINLNLANFVLVQNHNEEKRVMKFLCVEKNKVIYFPNSIPENIINWNKQFKNEFSKIIVVGREEKLENKERLKELFKNLLLEDKKIVIEIVGVKDKNKLDILLELEKRFKKRFSILPWLNKEKLFEKYKEVDIYLHTNTKSEGSPNTVIESQSQGLPVIAFDIEGVRDIIKNEYNGYLVRNYSEIEKKILFLKNNKEKLIKMSKNAVEIIKNNFSDEIWFPKLIELYNNLI